MKLTKREISLERAGVLKGRITDYLEAKKSITKGIEKTDEIRQRQDKIIAYFKATRKDFNNYTWQLKNRIRSVEVLKNFINLSENEIKKIEKVGSLFRWAISPYYLSLIDPDNPLDPVKLLSVPSYLELDEQVYDLDPMAEEYTNPAGCITRRYPDRLIMNVTNECAMYCRHCQRRRNIGQKDMATSKKVLDESLDYIRKNEEIRDVLITGGDPLTLPDDKLEYIIKALHEMKHIEYIRLGTRVLVTMPQRITDEFCEMLKKYHPIYINTHFNHPQEVTTEAKAACDKLSLAGVPLGNQAVLLNGINNDKFIMRCLNHELLKIRVRPYYIFHAKTVKGTIHFNTSIDDGMEIMEYLRGYTSGMAIPTYIVNAPKGMGKTPIYPEYLISKGKEYFMIRTWEGEVIKYDNYPTVDIKGEILKQR